MNSVVIVFFTESSRSAAGGGSAAASAGGDWQEPGWDSLPRFIRDPGVVRISIVITTQNLVTPKDNERLVYSVTEVGELLGISRAFAYELVARGEIPVIRLGRRRLVPKHALHRLIQAASASGGSAV